MNPVPVNSGCDKHPSGESWINFWTFVPAISESEALKYIEENNIRRMHGRPGTMFLESPEVYHDKEWTRITQFGGLDI